MSANGAGSVTGVHAASVSFLDLLWEPEEGCEADGSGQAQADDAACRAASVALQRRQAMHESRDGDADWSDVTLELPATAPATGVALKGRSANQAHALKIPTSDRAGRSQARLAGDLSPRSRLGGSGRTAHAEEPGGTDDQDPGGAPARVRQARKAEREIIVRAVRLLASPETQRRISVRLPGTSVQRELLRLWFERYRPVECETMFGPQAAASLRGLSARLRGLLARPDLLSLPIGSLLADGQWNELAGIARLALEAAGETFHPS